jgi:hypothetical protein
VKSTSQLRASQLERFERRHRDWAYGGGTWPHRINLGRPTPEAMSGTLQPLKQWIADWRAWDGGGTVDWTARRTVLGLTDCPATITFARADDIAALSPETATAWTNTLALLARIEAHWPGATPRTKPILGRLLDLDPTDQDRLVAVCHWLHANPHSSLYIRQLPIEGIDTKWIGRHRTLIAAMLEFTLPIDAVDAATDPPAPDADESFHERVGLRRVPQHINIVLCDPTLRAGYSGARTLALTSRDLEAIPITPRTVLIIENKETGYAVPDRPGLLVVHGLGLNLKALAAISWLRATRILYWGDIDAAGFEWLNNLRAYGVDATSLLMTEAIIDMYAYLATDGALPANRELSHLTREERDVHLKLVAGHYGRRFLLEQERLPWSTCLATLDSSLNEP